MILYRLQTNILGQAYTEYSGTTLNDTRGKGKPSPLHPNQIAENEDMFSVSSHKR